MLFRQQAVLSKQVGDFFQNLWPSHNVLTFNTLDFSPVIEQVLVGMCRVYGETNNVFAVVYRNKEKISPKQIGPNAFIAQLSS